MNRSLLRTNLSTLFEFIYSNNPKCLLGGFTNLEQQKNFMDIEKLVI
ncbi:MAG: hypothetical protein IPO14_04510 [Saprospiraceae bacterium]|nr:hypothetical protein [Saprospiraceae bacterium]